MTDSSSSSPNGPRSFLDEISTCWPTINDPVRFVMCYAPAIRKYMQAILKDANEADEAVQDFLVRILDRSVLFETEVHGRFRNYLKAAVRYTAISRLRRPRSPNIDREVLATIPQNASSPESAADREWLEQWRNCVLDRAWQQLDFNEQKAEGNLGYTVLRATVDNPDTDSTTLAQQVSLAIGRTLSPAAFRQQLSRARRQFAESIVSELRRSLTTPTRQAIEAELIDLDLHRYVKDCMPE